MASKGRKRQKVQGAKVAQVEAQCSKSKGCRRAWPGPIRAVAGSRSWCPASTRSRGRQGGGGFRAALPEATIYVYDNNSTDRTVEVARRAGAVVGRETHQGKGNVVRRMFADVEADVIVLVDGDATYDPQRRALIARLLEDRLDMVVAARTIATRPPIGGPSVGNRMFSLRRLALQRDLHRYPVGLRVFSRRFVKSFPVLSRGFEIEIELAVHALELELPTAEIPTPYYARPAGSDSKPQHLARRSSHPVDHRQSVPHERPLAFFCGLAARSPLSRLFCDTVFATYLEPAWFHACDRDPLDRPDAAGLSFRVAGLILDTVTKDGGGKAARLSGAGGAR